MKGAPPAARLRRIKMVLTDVDGVLTAGAIYHFVDTTGELVEFKGIHSHDSIALAWLAECGFVTGAISGRVSKGVEARLKILKVAHIYQHRLDKTAVLDEILKKEGLSDEQVAYMGDDLPDLPSCAARAWVPPPPTRAPRSRPPRPGSRRRAAGRGRSGNWPRPCYARTGFGTECSRATSNALTPGRAQG